MTAEQFKELNVGDVVRHPTMPHGYVVTSNNGSSVTLVRTVEASNPAEWNLVLKANHTVIP